MNRIFRSDDVAKPKLSGSVDSHLPAEASAQAGRDPIGPFRKKPQQESLNTGKKMEAYRRLEYWVVYQKYRAPEAAGTFHLAFARKCSIHVSLRY